MKKKFLSFVLCALLLIPSLISCNDTDIIDNKPHETLSTDSPSTTASPIIEPEPTETRISFLAAGDNIIHEAVFTDAMARAAVLVSTGSFSKKYEFESMYEGIVDMISSADIAFVNQEAPVGGDELKVSGYPNFNSPEDAGDALIEIGFDVINIANNHMLDKESIGLANTIDFFKNKDVLLIGGYKKSDYDNLRIVERDGIKIAFLSYMTLMNYDASGQKRAVTEESGLLIPYANEADMTRQMALAKNSGADLVFVSMHWGTENSFTVDAEQKKYTKLLADLGADVIIGHHSHTLQGIEWVEGTRGNKTLVAYSLGNLISTMHPNANMVGGLLTLDIVKSKDGTVTIESPLITPTLCFYSMKRDGLQIYKLEDVTDEIVNSHGSQLKGAFTLSTLKKYVTDSVSPEFLPNWIK